MADDREAPLDDAEEPTVLEEGPLQPNGPRSEVAVRRVGEPPAVVWRSRAVALRSALPQLARNPVVVGASAAAATVALRLAVDVARRAIGASSSPRPAALPATGSVLHHVHVVHHVHVIHHASDPVALRAPW